MKSAFGSKRKARKIQVDEEDDAASGSSGDPAEVTDSPASKAPTPSALRKPFKGSALRQAINLDDLQQDPSDVAQEDANRPSIGRSSSTAKRKKKPASSRLSFGPGEIISGDAAEALEDEEAFTPKKGLGRRLMDSDSLRKSLPYQGGSRPRDEDEDDRPTYSKDYLNELKSSTPNTPKDLMGKHAFVEDEQGLDASELEGAIIVDTNPSPAIIPSEAEIREKKERRARLAGEQDFISLDDSGSRQISLLPQKKKTETRLVREDEDLGEGFDEFVDDGRISLGKKQEREARKRQRKEMADMIYHAEGSADEDSDDSEAERRAAYEVAQTRAGMDGLRKPSDNVEPNTVQIPAKITPLPALTECLEKLKTTMNAMEQDLAQRKKRMEDLEQEKAEILAREIEVQELLKQAGARYSALKGGSNDMLANPSSQPGNEVTAVDRGLESFGTPNTRLELQDVG